MSLGVEDMLSVHRQTIDYGRGGGYDFQKVPLRGFKNRFLRLFIVDTQ